MDGCKNSRLFCWHTGQKRVNYLIMRVLFAQRKKGNIRKYLDALNALGTEYEVSLDSCLAKMYDKLILPGGADIDPKYFGEENSGSEGIDKEMDEGQFELLDAFVKAGKPVLGVCRGCQIVNVYFGGSLYQNLPTADAHKAISGEDQYHGVKSVQESVMQKLYGNEFRVNSTHHQGCKQIGNGLFPTLFAADGVVEALEHKQLPVLAVQWHPERTGFAYRKDEIADGEKIYRYFLNEFGN